MAINNRGFNLVEMMTGLAVSSVVLVGVFSVIGQLTQFENDTRIANLLNQTYFQGVQTARSSVRFKQLTKSFDAGLNACLSNKGTNCQAYQTAPKDLPADAIIGGQMFVDNTLNGSFGFYGACAPTEAHCLVQRTTQYAWECPNLNADPARNVYCTGVRIDVRSEMLPNAANKLRSPLKARVGSFVLSAREFQEKGNIQLSCAAKGSPLITGIDYGAAGNQDTCTTFDAGASCAMPMKTYASAGNCQNTQTKPCAQGFSTAGLYANQQDCVGTVDLSSTTNVPATCPGGGVMSGGSCVYANRWCPVLDAAGTQTLGFNANDTGAVHAAGCNDGVNWNAPGDVRPTGGTPAYAKCTSGPAAQFPLPDDPYCPATAVVPQTPTGGRWVEVTQTANWTNSQACPSRYPFMIAGAACTPLGATCQNMTGDAISQGLRFWFYRCL